MVLLIMLFLIGFFAKQIIGTLFNVRELWEKANQEQKEKQNK